MHKYLLAVILVSFIMFFPLTNIYGETLGDKWNSIKSSLQDAEKVTTVTDALKHLNNAKKIYKDDFSTSALELDPESNSLIENAFTKIESNLKSGNIKQASLERQIVDKTIYKIAFLKIEQAFKQNSSKQFLDWYTVMEKKFTISEKSSFTTNDAIVKIKKDPSELGEYSQIIKDELLSIFKLKTIEELEEAIGALEANKTDDAIKFAYEGLYYYRTLHPSIAQKLGQDTANELLEEMEDAIKVTTSNEPIDKKKLQLQEIIEEVELIIREYEGIEEGIGSILSGIKDRLVLVKEEYKDAVSDGKIIDQEEYDETIIFLQKATEIFSRSKLELSALSDTDVDTLESNLSNLKAIIDNNGDPQQVSKIVDSSITIVENLASQTSGFVEDDPLTKISKIKELLIKVKENYRLGQTEAALQLATSVYLDHYEFVEADIAYHDKVLMEKIEVAMREDLRRLIKERANIETVDAHIDSIIDDLEIAESVVPEFGIFTLAILLIGVFSVIILAKQSKLMTFPNIR